jgi:hypothetical protein
MAEYTTNHRHARPRRLPWPPRLPLAVAPDSLLELVAAIARRGPLLAAVQDELALREGSDRSGPRWPA